MERALAAETAELEIDIACRTLLAVSPDVVRTITVVLAGHDGSGAAPCLATLIAERYGLDAMVSNGCGCTKVRLVRRVPALSASPARR